MRYKVLFPEGRQNAFTLSYDDGQISDRRLVEMFNRYQLKASFHLNAGKIETKKKGDEFVSWEEIPDLYKGHEVACHGYRHPWFTQLTPQQLVSEILDDKRALEEAAGYPVRGMSYPFGAYSDEVCSVAASLGIEYSRTVNNMRNFWLPNDFMQWHPTCHHSEAEKFIDGFLHPTHYMDLQLFYVWGHSFEFDRENNWDYMERFCKNISGKENVWYATNIEIKEYVCASKCIVSSADGTLLYNPSAVTVWIQTDEGGISAVRPGECTRLNEKGGVVFL